MEVKFDYFRCMSNFIYSYENLRPGTSSCMKWRGLLRFWKQGPRGEVFGKCFSLDVKGVKASRVLVTGIWRRCLLVLFWRWFFLARRRRSCWSCSGVFFWSKGDGSWTYRRGRGSRVGEGDVGPPKSPPSRDEGRRGSRSARVSSQKERWSRLRVTGSAPEEVSCFWREEAGEEG